MTGVLYNEHPERERIVRAFRGLVSIDNQTTVLTGALWAKLMFPANQQTAELYNVFSRPADRHLWESNVADFSVDGDRACLPEPEAFSASKIIVVCSDDSADAAAFRESYRLQAILGRRVFHEYPLIRFPLWGELRYTIIEAPNRSVAVPSIQGLITEPWGLGIDPPMVIQSEVLFGAKLVGRPFTPVHDMSVTVLYEGLHLFRVQ
jgi:hypothetical protein